MFSSCSATLGAVRAGSIVVLCCRSESDFFFQRHATAIRSATHREGSRPNVLPPTDGSLNWLPEERVQTPSRVSDQEGLKRELKSGDGIKVVAAEGLSQMVEGGLCRLVGRRRRIVLRRGLGRVADGGQRGSDGGLGLLKSPPDPIGSRLAHVAVELAKGLQFVVGADGTLEEPPELTRTEGQGRGEVRSVFEKGRAASSRGGQGMRRAERLASANRISGVTSALHSENNSARNGREMRRKRDR